MCVGSGGVCVGSGDVCVGSGGVCVGSGGVCVGSGGGSMWVRKHVSVVWNFLSDRLQSQ